MEIMLVSFRCDHSKPACCVQSRAIGADATYPSHNAVSKYQTRCKLACCMRSDASIHSSDNASNRCKPNASRPSKCLVLLPKAARKNQNARIQPSNHRELT